MKVKATILIDKEVLERAHALGVNVSKACENCLRQYIQALQNVRFMKQDQFLSPGSSAEESGVRSPGFEPGSSAWEADVLPN